MSWNPWFSAQYLHSIGLNLFHDINLDQGGRSWFSGLWSPPKMVASNPLTNPLWQAVLNCTGRCPLSIMQSSLMYKYNLCVEWSNSYISANQQQRESKWSRWVQVIPVLITCGTVCSLNERLRRVPLKFEILLNKEQTIFKIKGMRLHIYVKEPACPTFQGVH